MSIASPDPLALSQLELGRHATSKLENDMMELIKYSKILEPMLMFPQ
jgi:hypothetical protein